MDRAAGERETHDNEKKSVDLSHRSNIELFRQKTVYIVFIYLLASCLLPQYGKYHGCE